MYLAKFCFGSGSGRMMATSKNVTSLFGFLVAVLYFLKEYPKICIMGKI